MMTRMAKRSGPLGRLAARIGRRGSYLLFLSLLTILFGWSLVSEPAQYNRYYDLLLTPQAWGWIWVALGALCLIQAFARVDRIAYSVACGIMVVWAAVGIYSWWIDPTVPREWVSSVIWFSFAGITAIISFWPEHRSFNLGDFDGDRE